jgi:Spy/CpxP family protein refolding chaperone
MVEDCGDLEKVPMKPAYFITVLVSAALMSFGCGNKNASKKPEMQNLVEEIPAEEKAPVQEDFLAKKLSLTAEQREQVGQINRKYAREVDSILRSDDYRSKKVRRFKSAMKNKDRELKKVLSKEQYEMYEKIREEMKQRLREAR